MAGNDGASSLQACAMRMTRLAADGSTPAGATNQITTSGIVKLDVKVVEEAGDDFTVKDGCGGIATAYKGGDRIKRLDSTLTITNPDVELSEMLTAGSLITSGGQSIGFSAPAVGSDAPLGVCLEIWTKAWSGGGAPPARVFTDGATTSSSTTLTSASAGFTSADVGRTISGTGIPSNTTISTVTNATTVVLSASATATGTGVSITIGRPGPYWRWVFPRFVGALSDFSLEDAPLPVVFHGPMYENPGIGNGPQNDFPTGGVYSRLFTRFRDTAIPATSVGYASTPAQV